MKSMEVEAARQQAMLAAIGARDADCGVAGFSGPAERAVSGLAIYRANAAALAERALGVGFPTLQRLLGADDFKHMAREFWRDDPPRKGDIGLWGEALPDWLRAHPGLAPWPYLGDCAELDWLLHCNERAADSTFDAASMSLLEAHDPERLRLLLMPGTAVFASRWPVASLHAAHEAGANGFDAVREALAAQRAEAVLVARRGWRGVVHSIDASTCAWSRDLLDGASLGAALARAASGFDFTAWLSLALTEGWLQGVVLEPETAG